MIPVNNITTRITPLVKIFMPENQQVFMDDMGYASGMGDTIAEALNNFEKNILSTPPLFAMREKIKKATAYFKYQVRNSQECFYVIEADTKTQEVYALHITNKSQGFGTFDVSELFNDLDIYLAADYQPTAVVDLVQENERI